MVYFRSENIKNVSEEELAGQKKGEMRNDWICMFMTNHCKNENENKLKRILKVKILFGLGIKNVKGVMQN